MGDSSSANCRPPSYQPAGEDVPPTKLCKLNAVALDPEPSDDTDVNEIPEASNHPGVEGTIDVIASSLDVIRHSPDAVTHTPNDLEVNEILKQLVKLDNVLNRTPTPKKIKSSSPPSSS